MYKYYLNLFLLRHFDINSVRLFKIITYIYIYKFIYINLYIYIYIYIYIHKKIISQKLDVLDYILNEKTHFHFKQIFWWYMAQLIK